MGIAGRVLKSFFIFSISLLVILALSWHFLPKGTSIKDAPKLLVDYRRGAVNPMAIKLLDMMLSEDQAENARRPGDDQVFSAGTYGRGAENVGDQLEGSIDGDVITFTGNTYDPSTLETIDKMHVSEDIKRELRRNYLLTGELPGVKLAIARDQKPPQPSNGKRHHEDRDLATNGSDGATNRSDGAHVDPSNPSTVDGAQMTEQLGGLLKSLSTTQ